MSHGFLSAADQTHPITTMRIIIVGAGSAGRYLAEKLCEERHDVVVIDINGDALDDLGSQMDVQTIVGPGSSPRILQEAGVDKADLLVAVTDKDEVNILSCAFAHAAGVSNKVARVSNPDFIHSGSRYDLKQLGIDLVISQKEECALEIFTVLRLPGTLEAVDMLDGRVLAVGIRVHVDSPLVVTTLKAFPEQDMLQRLRFIALMRGDDLSIPRGDTQFMIGDEVYLVGTPDDISEFLKWANPDETRYEKVIVAGGGDLGLQLTKMLEQTSMQVVLVEKDEKNAELCSAELNKALVIRGDALDQETLANAGVVHGTAFVAVTGSDEHNIMMSLLAEKAGATFTLAQVSRPEYVPIINTLSLLDRAVSSHMSMINAILHFIRGKNVKAAALLHKLPGELLEVGLNPSNRWNGKAIRDLKPPEGVMIATVVRNGEVCPATGDLTLQAGDRLVLFALPQAVGRVESMFQH